MQFLLRVRRIRRSCVSRGRVAQAFFGQNVSQLNIAAALGSRYTRKCSTKAFEKLYADYNDTWVDKRAPAAVKPYLKLIRIDRPIGTWLVLAPALWGLVLAAPAGTLPGALPIASFTLGAFLMRSAGCTINDIWDRDIDGKVQRTSQRPVASGEIPVPHAVAFLAAYLAAAACMLLPLPAALVPWAVGAVPLVVVYPLCKRFTHWPQAVLGLAMNWGLLMGAVAMGAGGGKQGVEAPSVLDALVALPERGLLPFAEAALQVDTGLLLQCAPAYLGAAAWTVVYDTIYAHYDTADDKKLGLKSTALLLGPDATKPVLAGFGLAVGVGLGGSAWLAGAAWPAYLAAAGATGHALWQVRTADLRDRLNLTSRFVSNQWVGLLVLLGLAGGKLLQGTADGPSAIESTPSAPH